MSGNKAASINACRDPDFSPSISKQAGRPATVKSFSLGCRYWRAVKEAGQAVSWAPWTTAPPLPASACSASGCAALCCTSLTSVLARMQCNPSLPPTVLRPLELRARLSQVAPQLNSDGTSSGCRWHRSDPPTATAPQLTSPCCSNECLIW